MDDRSVTGGLSPVRVEARSRVCGLLLLLRALAATAPHRAALLPDAVRLELGLL